MSAQNRLHPLYNALIRPMKCRPFLFLPLVSFLCICSVAAVPEATAQQRGGSLTYAENESVNVFNPYALEQDRGASDRLFTLIYEGLIQYDYDREQARPNLAQSWSSSGDEVVDSITFSLRENVTWHGGEPFTAEDVVFTYNYLINSDAAVNQGARQRYRNLIDRVEEVNEHTVVVHLREPMLNAVQYFQNWVLPAHAFEDNFLPAASGPDLSREPVGTGPYAFVERRLNGNITLERFEDYWGEVANVADMTMSRELDPSTMVIRALGGNLDLIVETPPSQIGRLEQSGEFNLRAYQSLSFHGFGFNHRTEPMNDPTFREALVKATNREQLLRNWFEGKGELLGGPFASGHSFFNPAVEPMPFNPEEAQRMLDGAGYADENGDGFRQMPDGSPLTIQFVTLREEAATSTVHQNVAASFESYAADVGIRVEVNNQMRDNYLTSIFQNHDFDVAWVRWTFDPSYNISSLFHSEQGYRGGNNFVGYENTRVDELLESFQSSKDPEQRRQLMYRIQEIIAEDMPYVFLYTVDNYASMHYSVVMSRIDPYYFFSYFNQWYIDPELR